VMLEVCYSKARTDRHLAKNRQRIEAEAAEKEETTTNAVF